MDKRVQASIRANGVFCSWDVVRDGGRDDDHGNLERLVVLPCFPQFRNSCECFETADNEQRLDVELLEDERNCLEIFTREPTVRSNLRSTLGCPGLSIDPLDVSHRTHGLIRVVADYARETVVERNWRVAASKAVRNSSSCGCVHASGWGTYVDDTDAHALVLW